MDVEQGVGMPPDEPADLGGPKFLIFVRKKRDPEV
jgi:hypothetical protein